ncbi:MAG: phage pi2 protein 07 [Flavobacteriaceae bacterium]|jgi:phage pi2 protein 07
METSVIETPTKDFIAAYWICSNLRKQGQIKSFENFLNKMKHLPDNIWDKIHQYKEKKENRKEGECFYPITKGDKWSIGLNPILNFFNDIIQGNVTERDEIMQSISIDCILYFLKVNNFCLKENMKVITRHVARHLNSYGIYLSFSEVFILLAELEDKKLEEV